MSHHHNTKSKNNISQPYKAYIPERPQRYQAHTHPLTPQQNMQIRNILTTTALLSASALATPLTAPLAARDVTTTTRTVAACFPPGIQASIQKLEGYLNTVIQDVAQKRYEAIAPDYSSTGRSLASLELDILHEGCAPSTVQPVPATTADQAIAYLRGTQAELLVLAQDAINSDCADGEMSICRAVHLYGAVAQYVKSCEV